VSARFAHLFVSAATVAIALGGAGSRAVAADTQATDASQAPQAGVGEVVVTARKQSENLQRVPVAVTSFSGNQLAQVGVRETTDLQRVVPSLTVAYTPINANTSQANAAVFSLRGQSAGDVLLTMSEPVGVYEDSVNVPHPDGLNGIFFDIQRVEVLKGPQGTLYGRNTTGGAVNIITRGADYNGLHGFIGGEVGNFEDWKVNGAVNLPIIDNVLAARISYQHWNRRGIGTDIVTGQHPGFDHNDNLVRLSLRFDPTASFASTTKVEYLNLDQVGYLQTLVAIPLQGSAASFEAAAEGGSLTPWLNAQNPFQVGSEAHLSDKVQTWHVAEDMTWSLTSDIKLRSITGYHAVSDFPTTDLDGTPFQILEIFAGTQGPQPIVNGPYTHAQIPEEIYHSVTQEFNLTGHAFGRVDWLVGGYASWENGYGGEPYIPFGALQGGLVSTTTLSNGENTNTWAVFTQDEVHILHNLSLTLGVRYTAEHIDNTSQTFNWIAGQYLCAVDNLPAPGNNPDRCTVIAQTENSNGVSYLVSLNYQVTPTMLTYFKTSRGFRGGALQFRASGFPPVQPELATDYELGFKGDFFEHRLRTNLALYHTDYSNKQESVVTTACGFQVVPATTTSCAGGLIPHSTSVLANAATATVNGFEGEFTAVPVTGWSLHASVTYLNGKYKAFNPAFNPDGDTVSGSGAPFQDPVWRYNIGTRVERPVGPGTFGASLDWSWRAHNNLTVVNISPSFSLALQQQLNAAVGLLDARVDYTLPDYGLTVAVFATNLLDKHYQTEALFSAALGIATASTQPPRMVGVSLTKTFGRE